MNSQEKELEELEAERRRKLELFLLGLLLSVNSEAELFSKLRLLSKDVYKEIMDIRKDSFNIADKYSEEKHKASDKNRKLIVASASLYLASMIARRIAISEKLTYLSKARSAIYESKPIIKRLVATEIFEANLKKMVANNINKKVRWNAVFDKRTCSTCESRDGRVYNAEDVPGYPHQLCRCFIEVVE